jgi:hypothetical protein
MATATAWSHYAAKHSELPYGFHENQLIRTDFFNTHACSQQLRIEVAEQLVSEDLIKLDRY